MLVLCLTESAEVVTIFKCSEIQHPKTKKIFTSFNLLQLPIWKPKSKTTCSFHENKFLQVAFSGVRQDCLPTMVEINPFPPGSILLPPSPNLPTPSGHPALELFLHPFYLCQELKQCQYKELCPGHGQQLCSSAVSPHSPWTMAYGLQLPGAKPSCPSNGTGDSRRLRSCEGVWIVMTSHNTAHTNFATTLFHVLLQHSLNMLFFKKF